MQHLKGWRTVAFNVVVAIEPVLHMTTTLDLIPPEYTSIYLTAVAVGNLLLRQVTDTKIGTR